MGIIAHINFSTSPINFCSLINIYYKYFWYAKDFFTDINFDSQFYRETYIEICVECSLNLDCYGRFCQQYVTTDDVLKWITKKISTHISPFSFSETNVPIGKYPGSAKSSASHFPLASHSECT